MAKRAAQSHRRGPEIGHLGQAVLRLRDWALPYSWLLAFTSCVTSLACGGSQAPAAQDIAPEKAKSRRSAAPSRVALSRVFLGENGLFLEVLDLDEQRALIVVRGVMNEITNLVLPYEKHSDGHALRYRTTWHGRPYNTLVQVEGPGNSGEGDWKVFLPGAGQRGLPVVGTHGSDSSVDEQAIFETYQNQQSDGSLDEFMTFDRAAEERASEQTLEEEQQSTAQRCGHAIAVYVRWDTISDEQMMEESIPNYCGSLFFGLRQLCRDEAGRTFLRNNVQAATCRLDGDHELSLEKKHLVWAIGFDTVNLPQEAVDALRTLAASGDARLD